MHKKKKMKKKCLLFIFSDIASVRIFVWLRPYMFMRLDPKRKLLVKEDAGKIYFN